MEYECIIISLIYIRRLIEYSDGKLVLASGNWKGIVLSCSMLANKVWDDFHMRNVDYAEVFAGLTISRVNALEKCLLQCIGYRCNVAPSLYAQTHFEIQSMITQISISKSRPIAKKLHHAMTNYASKVIPVAQSTTLPVASHGNTDCRIAQHFEISVTRCESTSNRHICEDESPSQSLARHFTQNRPVDAHCVAYVNYKEKPLMAAQIPKATAQTQRSRHIWNSRARKSFDQHNSSPPTRARKRTSCIPSILNTIASIVRVAHEGASI